MGSLGGMKSHPFSLLFSVLKVSELFSTFFFFWFVLTKWKLQQLENENKYDEWQPKHGFAVLVIKDVTLVF